MDIRNAFSLVSYLQCVGFSDVSSKLITIPNPDRRPADLTYFTFRSVVSAARVDIRALASSLFLKFSLLLPQSLSIITSKLCCSYQDTNSSCISYDSFKTYRGSQF